MVTDKEFQQAVQAYWDSRGAQQAKQIAKGMTDAGLRSAVTGGGQMAALEALTVREITRLKLKSLQIETGKGIELPGYFRPEKKWDLLILSQGELVAAVEYKSQVGPSFGNNFNNRTEEAIGNAVDIWTAYRENRFGKSPRPFLGYFFLLEDCPKVHTPVKCSNRHFPIDPAFVGASYAKRYELLCRRLVLERLYDSACLTLATKENQTVVQFQAEDQTYERFLSDLLAAASRFK